MTSDEGAGPGRYYHILPGACCLALSVWMVVAPTLLFSPVLLLILFAPILASIGRAIRVVVEYMIADQKTGLAMLGIGMTMMAVGVLLGAFWLR